MQGGGKDSVESKESWWKRGLAYFEIKIDTVDVVPNQSKQRMLRALVAEQQRLELKLLSKYKRVQVY